MFLTIINIIIIIIIIDHMTLTLLNPFLEQRVDSRYKYATIISQKKKRKFGITSPRFNLTFSILPDWITARVIWKYQNKIRAFFLPKLTENDMLLQNFN